MSGGVGPTGDSIRLPPEEAEHAHKSLADSAATAACKSLSSRGGFLSFRQLNALAAIIVFSASSMVSASDIAFAIVSLIYVHFLSLSAFPRSSPSSSPDPPVFGDRNLLLSAYVSAGALIGLFLPIAYILEGVLEGDKEGIKAAAPHVFLLACQVFMEGVTFSRRFSLPVRAFVPVFYNTRRLFTIADWLRNEVGKEEELHHGSAMRLVVGRALALANLAFWSFNLFGFLLPVYLPRALKKYYAGQKVKD